jgi:hypothetical protein
MIGLSGEPEMIRLPQPAHQWVPTGENLGHQTFIFGSGFRTPVS